MPKVNFILVLACLVVTWRVSSHEQTKNPVNLTGSQNPDVQHVHDHDDTTDQRTGEAGDFSESNFHGVIHDATEREDSAEPGDAKPDGGKDSISDTRLVAMPCGYYGYWNETKKMCLTCPFCPEGQKLTEPCGNGHVPSEHLDCVDCPETAPGYYSDGCTHMCHRCTICSQYHRDVITPCTNGSNTVCSSTCSEGYEMRKISLREGGNMFICQAVETNGENGESGHTLRQGLLAFLCLVIVLACAGVVVMVVYRCCNRRAHQVIPQYVD